MDRFCCKFKKNNNTCFASAPGQWRPDTHCLLFSSRARPDRADDRYCDYRSNCVKHQVDIKTNQHSIFSRMLEGGGVAGQMNVLCF